MSGALILTVAALLAAVFLLVRARFWPYGRCWACRGRRRGRGLGSTGGAYNRCHFCGGGEIIRPLSRIYPKWNKEAKRRRAQIREARRR